MKNTALSILAIAALSAAGISPAYAGGGGILCKILPFFCVAPIGSGGKPASVPEPATMAVLAAGVAASLAARRRRRSKNDE